MIRLKLILAILATCGYVLGDFEDCEVVDLNSFELSKFSLVIKREVQGSDKFDHLLINLSFDADTFIVKPIEISEGLYDGFFCSTENKDMISPLGPCKNYIVHAEKQTKLFSNSMKCFRATSSSEPSETSFILVLNRINPQNTWEVLWKQNLYESQIRFLLAVTDWVNDSLGFVEPLINESNKLIEEEVSQTIKHENRDETREPKVRKLNPQHWFLSLIVERLSDDRIFVRYRYINTKADDMADKKRIAVLVEEVFRLIKNFFYFNTSCFSIIQEVVEKYKDSNIWSVLKNHPGYPRNFGLVLDFLKQGYIGIFDENGTPSQLPYDLAHMYLIQTVVFGYCTREIRFTQQQLTGLNILLKSLFTRDIFFQSFEDHEDFEAFFLLNKDCLAFPPTDSSDVSPEVDTSGIGKFFKDFDIVDHPPFKTKVKRESGRNASIYSKS